MSQTATVPYVRNIANQDGPTFQIHLTERLFSAMQDLPTDMH